jgi:uncharacterized Zn finger protein (UPF0148 family)
MSEFPYLAPLPHDYPMTNWDCPQCGHQNYDFCDQHTHCAFCGRVVWVLGEGQGAVDENWNVPIDEFIQKEQGNEQTGA